MTKPIRYAKGRVASGTTLSVSFDEATPLPAGSLLLFLIHVESSTAIGTPSGFTALTGNGANGTNQLRAFWAASNGTINGASLTGLPNVAKDWELIAFPHYTGGTPVSGGGNVASGTSTTIAAASPGATAPGVMLRVLSLSSTPTAWGFWEGSAIPLENPSGSGMAAAWFDYTGDPTLPAKAQWTGTRTGRIMEITVPLNGDLSVPSIASGGSVSIVAHPDDDLSMISPAQANDITGLPYAATVFLTSGDASAGWGIYAQAREAGLRNAYATYAGVPNAWTTGTTSLDGKTITWYALRGAPVRLYFYRLPDTYNVYKLQRLWDGTDSTITAIDGPQTFTKAQLLASLAALIDLHGATTLRTMNYRDTFGAELHPDHNAAAFFGHQAGIDATTTVDETTYLMQQMVELPANLGAADYAMKLTGYLAYVPYDNQWGADWQQDPTWDVMVDKVYPIDVATYPAATAGVGSAVTGMGASSPAGLTTGTDATKATVLATFEINAGADTVVAGGLRVFMNAATDISVNGTGYAGHLWRSNAAGIPQEWVASAYFGTVSRGAWASANFAVPVELPLGTYSITVTFPRGRPSLSTTWLTSDRVSPVDSRMVYPRGADAYQGGFTNIPGLVDFQGTPFPPPPNQDGWYGIDATLWIEPSGVAYDRTPADSAGVTDAVSHAQGVSRSTTDTVGATDSTQLDRGLVAADTLAASDVATVAQAVIRSSSDAAGITETVAVAITVERTVADGVAITDSVTVEYWGAGAANPSDSVGVTDTANAVVTVARTIADSIGATDATALEASRGQSDPAAIADAVTVAVSVTRAPTDTVGVTDSVTVELTSAGDVSIADPLGVSDVVTVSVTRAVVLGETVAIVDVAVLSGESSGPPPVTAHRLLTIDIPARLLDLSIPGRVLDLTVPQRTLEWSDGHE